MEVTLDDYLTDHDMDDLNQRKAMGLSYLENNNFKEAVNIYKKILMDYPEDIESYLLLGDLYIANEDYPSAEKIYQKALSLEPDNVILQRRVKLSNFELSTHDSEEIPTDSASVSKLLQEITGRPNPVTEDEIQKAAGLLDTIVHATNPAEMVARQLDQIDNLLPALIELNIRQARNDRRFDLVTMLQALQENISYMMDESQVATVNVKGAENTDQPLTRDWSQRNIHFLVPDPDLLSDRARNIVETLQETGCNVTFATPSEKNSPEKADLVIACNPHINPAMMEKMANFSALHVPILLDLDEDFEYMPIIHPDYTFSGLGSLEKSRSYTASLLFANMITVPNEAMAAHIRESGYKVEVVHFGWSKKNEQWHKPLARRSTVNIGLIGIQGNFEDVQKYRRIIVRVLREFPQTRLVVCGDSITYKMFENISENRRVFLPRVPDEDMSYILGQIDILLVPLNVTPFHLVTSDRLLMQAGVKGIPWIASPMPDFIRWQAGGVTAENPDEWHSYLRQFIQDKELRLTLGQAGRNQAIKREEVEIGKRWMEVIQLFFDSTNHQ